MENFRDVEIFDESGFWYAADFEDLTPFTLYRMFEPDDGSLVYSRQMGSELLCLSYPDGEGIDMFVVVL